jgi:hypothetical protein
MERAGVLDVLYPQRTVHHKVWVVKKEKHSGCAHNNRGIYQLFSISTNTI